MESASREANGKQTVPPHSTARTTSRNGFSDSHPAERNGRPHKPPRRLERWLAHRLLEAAGRPHVQIVLWDGTQFGESPGGLRLRLLDRGALWRLATEPLFQFGELYASGRLAVEGDLLAVLLELDRALNRADDAGARPHGLSRWVRRPHRNTLAGSRENIHRHYDIGNKFYKLWLDEQLLYTCAYFPQPDMPLEAAQIAKMDHVCRKLQLRPGARVIEAGCGWGALALHMARQYGVRVRAYNISREQIAHARRRAEQEGLNGLVEFVEDDWRNIDGRCDAFVSVGMLEHVGRQNYGELGKVIHRCLEPHGRGLIHSIGQNRAEIFNPWVERRIFPGAYPPSLREMMDIFEPRSFSVLDIENLRLHYAETLHHWLERYERAVETVRGMFDEQFVRAWRLYLAGSIAAFETGRLQLFQIVFTHGENNNVPRTREHVYPAAAERGPQ